ncbi:MAG: amidohydrolase [Eubacteriales bacterium]|nr:amidohydrolase [Eubacteriales bacterium]
MKKIISITLCLIMTVCTLCGVSRADAFADENSDGDAIFFGHIITMDEENPTAEALAVRDGVIIFAGTMEEAAPFIGTNTKVYDYEDSFIYPGFLEAHTHGYLAGYRAIGQADLSPIFPTDYDEIRRVIKEFIKQNPDRDIYLAAGWVENEEYVSRDYLDEICSDKPLIMNTGGGHSCLLNTKALEWAGIDAAYAKEVGYEMVHVDEDGEPDGYICEMPAIEVVNKIPVTFEDAKTYLLNWQNYAFENGFTAVADAGADLAFADASKVYHELEEEGKLKLRTYSYLMVPDNAEDPSAEISRIVEDRAKYSDEYYHIIGVKVFLDGVTEAHTAWQTWDYADEPGYHGVERFNDHDKMVELITAADAEGLSVHVHSEGSGATHFMLNCIEDAEKITGDMDQRNVIAHLHFVDDEDIQRMVATGSIPAVAPLWTPKFAGEYENEVSFVGQEHADNSYPIKSFCDAGANIVFHSDYPITPEMNINRSIYMAELRAVPEEELGGLATQRNIKEAISREQALRAMTINVAYAWKQEDRIGSLEVGKLANMSVFDCDFLHDDAEKVSAATVIATVIDGEEVYNSGFSSSLLISAA